MLTILHILNSPRGGATGGVIELLKTARRLGAAHRHIVTFPGKTQVPLFAELADLSVPARFRSWSRSREAGARRLLTEFKSIALRPIERRSRDELLRLIDREHVDVIHSNAASVDLGVNLSAASGRPHVWHIRERLGSDGLLQFPVPFDAALQRIADTSDAVVGMSHFAAEPFRSLRVPHLRVVYDGVDSDEFDNSAARDAGRRLRDRLGLSGSDVLVAKVASVTCTAKRHESFISAAAVAAARGPAVDARVKFAVFGHLPRRTAEQSHAAAYFRRLKQQVADCGLTDRFIWAGQVADPAAVMNAIDVLVHTCPIEGFGRISIEAAAAGVPVVGPNCGGFAEAVVHGVTGFLVDPSDAAAIARHVTLLLQQPGNARAMGAAGRDFVRRFFTNERYYSAMSAVYRSVAQSQPTTSAAAEPVLAPL